MEGWTLLVMVVALVAGVFAFRFPTGIALFLSAVAAALFAGHGLPFRHLAEGAILYLDPILLVVTSLFFMAVFERSGALATLNTATVRAFGSRPRLLLVLLTLFVMFPGMLTGLTAPCVLTTGAMIAPVLIGAGLSRARVGAFLATAAFFGMVAPPVNIAAMLICSGVDMPYVGFGWPLLIATVPLAIVCSFLIAGKGVRGLRDPKILDQLPPSRYGTHGFKLYLPLLLLLVLLFGAKSFPEYIPYIGVPLMFVLAGILGLFTGDRMRVGEVLTWAIRQSLPIVGLLVGIGVFIQILTLTGARGFIVVETLTLPPALLFVGMAVLVPLFGGVSAYGSSSVLGVPLLLALLHYNDIMVAAAISLLASVGDFLPPTRLAVILAAPVVKEEPGRVLRASWIPVILAILWGLAMIFFANPLAKLIGLN
ncbi:TRAP transporter large permease subunit [bacterium]|nr:TRAP transporter large permease subunit [bacterium]MBU1983935.1 TRAP transporter large permease subunit [bacterium]